MVFDLFHYVTVSLWCQFIAVSANEKQEKHSYHAWGRLRVSTTNRRVWEAAQFGRVASCEAFK
ncbi:hypothetical protein A1OW_16305 [Enterovibrio norvegicus]|nr:hypothetical protein A1OW_16305 [Enterovibrio norvegicus]